MFLVLLLALPVLAVLFYFYWIKNYGYWEKQNIPCISGEFPFGNIKEVFFLKKTMAQLYDDMYKAFENEPMVGFYKMRTPMLLVREPELIKTVLVREFNNFQANDFYCNKTTDPIISKNPFSAVGQEWKDLRAVHVPYLTPAKLKGMTPLMLVPAQELVKYLKNNNDYHEGREIMSHFTIDAVATVAFGVETNSFKEPNSDFRRKGANVFGGDFSTNLAVMFSFYAPFLLDILRLKMVQQSCADYFTEVITNVVKTRRENGIVRDDILQSLINYNIEAETTGNHKPYTNDEITEHAMTFFFDGFNTTSLTLTHAIHNLSQHPEVQKLAREEIKQQFERIEDITYEKLQNLPYLQSVIDETLRMYPIVPAFNKLCTKDTTLSSNGIEVKVKAGTSIAVPAISMHMDPKHYPEPEKFIPDRFSPEARAERDKIMYLGFSEGPRICLGQRMAYIQSKIALAALLLNFHITPKYPEKKLLQQDTSSSFMFFPKGGVWAKFTPLDCSN